MYYIQEAKHCNPLLFSHLFFSRPMHSVNKVQPQFQTLNPFKLVQLVQVVNTTLSIICFGCYWIVSRRRFLGGFFLARQTFYLLKYISAKVANYIPNEYFWFYSILIFANFMKILWEFYENLQISCIVVFFKVALYFYLCVSTYWEVKTTLSCCYLRNVTNLWPLWLLYVKLPNLEAFNSDDLKISHFLTLEVFSMSNLILCKHCNFNAAWPSRSHELRNVNLPYIYLKNHKRSSDGQHV